MTSSENEWAAYTPLASDTAARSAADPAVADAQAAAAREPTDSISILFFGHNLKSAEVRLESSPQSADERAHSRRLIRAAVKELQAFADRL
jgi:hypothetical protein